MKFPHWPAMCTPLRSPCEGRGHCAKPPHTREYCGKRWTGISTELQRSDSCQCIAQTDSTIRASFRILQWWNVALTLREQDSWYRVSSSSPLPPSGLEIWRDILQYEITNTWNSCIWTADWNNIGLNDLNSCECYLSSERDRGLFLESPEILSGPKSQLSNCNPLVLQSWSFNMILM